MTRDEARQLLPIIQAYSEGKTVIWRNPIGQWIDQADGVAFFDPPDRYRIKPEPVECWAVVTNYQPHRVLRFHHARIDARSDADNCIDCRVIRMREVHE